MKEKLPASSTLKLVNRVVTVRPVITTDAVTKISSPEAICVSVCLTYDDDSSQTLNEYLDLRLIPYDVAMNIACEIVRGWNTDSSPRK